MRDFDPDTRLRLTRYITGASSPAESDEFEGWLAADPLRQRELDALRWIWEASAGLPPADRMDEMWTDLVAKMRGIEWQPPTPHRPAPRRTPGWRRWGFGAAAAASLALAVLYGIHEWSPTPTLGPESPQEYRTIRGQRGTIQLDDGTRIDLGVASVVRVHPLTRGRQTVELEGEAVFEVIRDPARTFAVRSRNAVIEDIGTRFGVRAYEGDDEVRVVVAEGKVAVRLDAAGPDTAAVLAPGELATIDSAGRTQVRRGVHAESYFGWVGGRLLFENATLAEVAADLERWYDVDITFARPTLASRRVTLSMPVSSLVDALDAVTAPLGLTYARDSAVVTLHPR